MSEIDEFHIHEALHGMFIIQCMFDEHIAQHPVVADDKELAAFASGISEEMADLYQRIGAKRLLEELEREGE